MTKFTVVDKEEEEETKVRSLEDSEARQQTDKRLRALERLKMLDDWERDMEIRDKYSLMAFGLKCKAAWTRKRAILDAVSELKRRFKILLFEYLKKRDDRRFAELQDLIMNFDSKPGY